jgi:uncharacterized protein (DUF4415 family)
MSEPGSMSTPKDEDLDYQKHARHASPEPGTIRRGVQDRADRRARAKERITIRIDQDILERFKELAPQGMGYQSLINDALRDWLNAQSVKELIREELEEMAAKVLSVVQTARTTTTK